MESISESVPLSLEDVENAAPYRSDVVRTVRPITVPSNNRSARESVAQPDTQEVDLDSENEEEFSLSTIQESKPDTGDEILKIRESTRSRFVYFLLGLLSLVILTYIIVSAIYGFDEFKDAVQQVLPLITGILGIAAGYYFSDESSKRGSTNRFL